MLTTQRNKHAHILNNVSIWYMFMLRNAGMHKHPHRVQNSPMIYPNDYMHVTHVHTCEHMHVCKIIDAQDC